MQMNMSFAPSRALSAAIRLRVFSHIAAGHDLSDAGFACVEAIDIGSHSPLLVRVKAACISSA